MCLFVLKVRSDVSYFYSTPCLIYFGFVWYYIWCICNCLTALFQNLSDVTYFNFWLGLLYVTWLLSWLLSWSLFQAVPGVICFCSSSEFYSNIACLNSRHCVWSNLSLFQTVPKATCLYSRLCLKQLVSVPDCVQSNLFLFQTVSEATCFYSRLCPKQLVSIPDCVGRQRQLKDPVPSGPVYSVL